MLLALLAWLYVLFPSKTVCAATEISTGTSSLDEDKSIEMIEMPNIRTPAARRYFRRIKSFSPRSETAQSFFNITPPPDNMKLFSKSFDEEADENESCTNMSTVSESFLEDLGLRSRPSTPSLASPSIRMSKISSSPSSFSSLRLLHPRLKSGELQSSSEESSGEGEGFDSDKALDYQFDFLDLDSDYNDSKELEITVPPDLNLKKMEIETVAVMINDSVKERRMSSLKLSNLPDFLLTNILEFISDSSLLEIRLTDHKFKQICDVYLNFLTNLTLKPLEEVPIEAKYHLSSTMMPFFKNQPQIRSSIESLLNCGAHWNLLSLNELYSLGAFRKVAIFSDSFIKELLLPRLRNLQRSAGATAASADTSASWRSFA